jgi:hypothetical protein
VLFPLSALLKLSVEVWPRSDLSAILLVVWPDTPDRAELVDLTDLQDAEELEGGSMLPNAKGRDISGLDTASLAGRWPINKRFNDRRCVCCDEEDEVVLIMVGTERDEERAGEWKTSSISTK